MLLLVLLMYALAVWCVSIKAIFLSFIPFSTVSVPLARPACSINVLHNVCAKLINILCVLHRTQEGFRPQGNVLRQERMHGHYHAQERAQTHIHKFRFLTK